MLGAPSKHSLTQSLLPIAATSPLLLPALIGWSASHLARIGEPYASIATIATEVTDRRVEAILHAGPTTDGPHGHVTLEDKLWIVLMLGGIEVSTWANSYNHLRVALELTPLEVKMFYRFAKAA